MACVIPGRGQSACPDLLYSVNYSPAYWQAGLTSRLAVASVVLYFFKRRKPLGRSHLGEAAWKEGAGLQSHSFSIAKVGGPAPY